MFANGVQAQFTDNFSDGNFTANPTWTGSNSAFAVASGQLHLQAPAEPGEKYLSTNSQAIEEAQWEFFVRLDFNPSSNNLAKIYLVSDQSNLLNPLNGYFVRIGGTEDEVSLYRQSGTSTTKIINGQDDRVDESSVTLKVKVTRSASGNWELFSDTSGSLVSEGAVIDATFPSSKFFGVVCQYTATRSDKFSFDDFVVTGQPFKDRIPPVLSSMTVVSNTQMRLQFSEAIAAAVATNVQNYQVSNNVGQPDVAVLETGNQVLLSFNPGFANGVINQLSVSGIKDLSGNLMAPRSLDFRYFKPGLPDFLEVVVTEFMADPDPALALPASEYIEIFNRGDQVFDLGGWVVADLNNEVVLPSRLLFPQEYLILCPLDHEAALSAFGKTLGLSAWPTLNNDGDHIRLIDSKGTVINSLTYDATWYRSSFKREGGWSLEMIDIEYPCSGGKNWIASESESGGTPGNINSVAASNPDLTGPQLISAFANGIEQVILYFDEPLNPNSAITGTFEIDQGVVATNATFQGLQEIILQVDPVLSQNSVYQIKVANITDCNGNLITDEFNTATFALPQEADSLDIVINEVLFNPRPMGKRFVELFNRSNKYINIKNWRLANQDSGRVTNPKIILENQNLVLAPGSYGVITTNTAILKGEYPKGQEENFIEAQSLPSYPDDAGTVVLLNQLGNVMDWFDYQETYHYPLLNDRNGVSLERLAPEGITNDPNNWKSAASTVGFATPGYKNSQSNQGGSATNPIEINPKLFSFNTPGIPYFTTIHYSFPDFGQVANVEVFDPQGHGIRKVAQNELLQSKGSFTWDGTNDRGQKVRAGYYLILFEVFNLNGEVAVYKETVAVTSAF